MVIFRLEQNQDEFNSRITHVPDQIETLQETKKYMSQEQRKIQQCIVFSPLSHKIFYITWKSLVRQSIIHGNPKQPCPSALVPMQRMLEGLERTMILQSLVGEIRSTAEAYKTLRSDPCCTSNR
jgi:hypothetical protein